MLSSYGPNFNISYPASFSDATNSMSAVSININSLPLKCGVQYDFSDILVMQTLVPYVLIVSFIALGRILDRRKVAVAPIDSTSPAEVDIRRQMVDALYSWAFLLSFLFYPGTSGTIFKALAPCFEFESGPSYLIADMSIACDSAKYAGMVSYATVMLFLWVFGIPAFYAYLMFKNRVGIAKLVAAEQQQDATRALLLADDNLAKVRPIRKQLLALVSMVDDAKTNAVENGQSCALLPLAECWEWPQFPPFALTSPRCAPGCRSAKLHEQPAEAL